LRQTEPNKKLPAHVRVEIFSPGIQQTSEIAVFTHDKSRTTVAVTKAFIKMNISFIKPRQELQPYIESFWVCESATGMPVTDRNLAVPNGCAKLIIPYENSLFGACEGRSGVSCEHGFYFVGNRETATLISSSKRKTGFIGIEFSPHGAFPLFGIRMSETVDEKMFDSEVLFGRWGRETRESLCNLEEIDQKVSFIQDELVGLSRRKRQDNRVVDFCVKSLKLAHGLVPMKDLERKTGYTRRYLNMLFKEHVGLPPKVLARIFRFQLFYRKWAQGLSYNTMMKELYDYYYDQAHFSKEFKRMTGHSPQEFMVGVSNEFGRRIVLK
jgi:AraC-like DNA-binding protein